MEINIYAHKREYIINYLQNNNYVGSCFFQRILYIEFCLLCGQKFSRNFLKQYNMFNFFDYSTDNILQVRLKLAKSLPLIKTFI